MTCIEDLNGDGRPEVVIAPFYGTTEPRHVYLLSGADGAVMGSVVLPDDGLEVACATACSLGADDATAVLALGLMPCWDPPTIPTPGGVLLMGGSSLSVIRELPGPSYAKGFGFSMLAGEDVDGDGVSDLIVGAPWEGDGAIYVISGQAKEIRCLARPELKGTRRSAGGVPGWGAGMAWVPDQNSDGVPDIAVGSQRIGEVGTIAVLSSRDGSLLRHVTPTILPGAENPTTDSSHGCHLSVTPPDAKHPGGTLVSTDRTGAWEVFTLPNLLRVPTRDRMATNSGLLFVRCLAAIGDFNSDGIQDWFQAYRRDPAWSVEEGDQLAATAFVNGEMGGHWGVLSPVAEYAEGIEACANADLDGDGLKDVIVLGVRTRVVRAFPTGQFLKGLTYPALWESTLAINTKENDKED
jgi:hypothetical protein